MHLSIYIILYFVVYEHIKKREREGGERESERRRERKREGGEGEREGRREK